MIEMYNFPIYNFLHILYNIVRDILNTLYKTVKYFNILGILDILYKTIF